MQIDNRLFQFQLRAPAERWVRLAHLDCPRGQYRLIAVHSTVASLQRGCLRNWSELMPAAPRTVAIVDDDAELLKGLQRLLNAHGLGTKAFSSAEAFLATNSGVGIDCVLLDVHLGGMSGIALRRALSASGSRLPVIFMTAFDDEATRQQAQAAGCVAYLRKPFPGRVLIEAIAQAVPNS